MIPFKSPNRMVGSPLRALVVLGALSAAATAVAAVAVATNSAPAPPAAAPLPIAFTVAFVETLQVGGGPVASNTGAWAYDFTRPAAPLWRADHNEPQANNFCACAANETTVRVAF
jgi:hypothetical protein